MDQCLALVRKDSSSMMRDIYIHMDRCLTLVRKDRSSMTRDIYPYGPVSDISEERQV